MKLVLAPDVLIVTESTPMFALEADRVGVVARGMVFSVPVPLPLLTPIFTPLKYIPEKDWLKEYEKDLVPSALCVIVVDPLARVFVSLFPIATLTLPLYGVPFTVTLHG